MSKYSIEAPVRSRSLSTLAVERLEKYIFEKAAAINQIPIETVREDYQIEAVDALGTETLRSIHEHGRHQFYNDTTRLVLTYRRYHDKLTTLKISFGVRERWSTIQLTVEGPNARETAMSILQELRIMLRDGANLNFMFHGRYLALPLIVFGISMAMLPLLLDARVSEPLRTMNEWIAIGIGAFWALFAITRTINPYVVFDTSDNAKTQQAFGWGLKLLLGAVALAGLSKLLLV
jgi:hypothetical protein